MSKITLSFMERFINNLDTAIKNYVKGKNSNEKGSSITTGTDLDTMKTVGVYYIADDATASNIGNVPLALCGKVLVMDNGNGGYSQFYIPNHSPRIFQRLWWGNAWTDWIELAPKSYVDKFNCPTTTDGTFNLVATVSNGVVTYSWVAQS